MDRREFVAAVGALTTLAACGRDGAAPITESAAAPPTPALAPAETGVLRVASVKTAVEGNLLPELVAQFEKSSPYRVRIATGTRVYDLARAGDADLVVSHYGHKDAEAFVLDGLGEWPRTIFSNQMALLGAARDPAGVLGMEDVVEAFRKIAAMKAPFVVNDLDGVRYLTEILWNAVGRPDRTGWLIDAGTQREAALAKTAALGGYTLWGLTPFLRTAAPLEPLVLADPLLQRMMVSVIVKPGDGRRTNLAAANAFQSYLLHPATQAAIRLVRYPGKRDVNWAPGGRHNRTAMLPKV
jgi:tungstate transport system substrate-binding protein